MSAVLRDFYQAKGLLTTGEHDACGVGGIYSITGPSYEVIESALKALGNIGHRGVKFADGKTGDGAGIRLQLPRAFISFIREAAATEKGFNRGRGLSNDINAGQRVAVGQFFFEQLNRAKMERLRRIAEKRISASLVANGYAPDSFAWRTVPVDMNYLGPHAQQSQPAFEQLILPHHENISAETERQLYVLRQMIEQDWLRAGYNQESSSDAYICSLSADSITYKGMPLAENIAHLYPDLKHAIFSNIEWAQIHQRMSTNTTSTADKAHPYRFIAHNGEINTLRGNIIFFTDRQKDLVRRFAGEDAVHEISSIIQRGASDTATYDNILEALVRTGMSMPTALSVMTPSAYGIDAINQNTILTAARDISNAWDGPVAMIAINEDHFVAMRDRNGLRPTRIVQTKSGLIIAGSEMGMVPLQPHEIARVIPLGPGEKLAINRRTGHILMPADVEAMAAKELGPIAHAVAERESAFVFKPTLPQAKTFAAKDIETAGQDLFFRQARAHYTVEALERTLNPIVLTGKEPTWSMGDDAALAVFDRHRALDFFYAMMRQEFAQVTNPATDSVNERGGMVTVGADGKQSLNMPIGDLGAPLPSPVLWSEELEAIERDHADKFVRIDATYDPSKGNTELRRTLRRIRAQTEKLVEAGNTQIILTHAAAGEGRLPIPMPLIVSTVHSNLVNKEMRGKVAIHAHTQEMIETHKLAMLLASGANFVTPYMVEETIGHAAQKGAYKALSDDVDVATAKAFMNYRKALDEGYLKIIGKMGISVPASYSYNFSFEGLYRETAKEFFPGVASPLGGIKLGEIQERQVLHAAAANEVIENALTTKNFRLAPGSSLRYLQSGDNDELTEMHIWKPEVIKALQDAAVNNSLEDYKNFVEMQKPRRKEPILVRDLMKVEYPENKLIPLDQVQPRQYILDRMLAPGISLGALSSWVHRDVAKAMNNLRRQSMTGDGPKSNSGEGGEDIVSRRMNGANTSVKQIASGRFGVTAPYLADADVIEIKVAQGAKPGLGGELPGMKVEGLVAELRYATPGVGLISPPPHHDIYSIEDLTQLITDLKTLNPRARVNVKLVSQPGIGQIAVGVAKARADGIHISGGSGGTGASPQSAIKNSGCSVETGLAEVHQALKANDLRDNIKLSADGSVITGLDILKLILLGADEVGIGTASLVALGCVMTHKCHLNVCPAGVATQDAALEEYYHGKPEFLENYFRLLADDVRTHLAKLGIEKIEDAVGRVEFLKEYFTSHLDLSPILALHESELGHASGSRLQPGQRNEPPAPLDDAIGKELDADGTTGVVRRLQAGERIHTKQQINNTNLSVGARFAGQIAYEFILNKIDACKRDLPRDEHGNPDAEAVAQAVKAFEIKYPDADALHIDFEGTAGQSFGAFMVPGMKFVLTGGANDYAGKGMHGGTMVIRPDERSVMSKAPDENEIAGSTLLMGATGGKAFISGTVRERFMVRGSGVQAVVEGCGDYGCEYMSGGMAVILGKTGKFFGSGMKGGLAFLYDGDNSAVSRVNKTDVAVYGLNDDGAYQADVKALITKFIADSEKAATSHVVKIGSKTETRGDKHPLLEEAKFIIANWDEQKEKFNLTGYEDQLKATIAEHAEETGSPKAMRILANWDQEMAKFKVVVPKDVINLVANPGKYDVDVSAFTRGETAATERKLLTLQAA